MFEDGEYEEDAEPLPDAGEEKDSVSETDIGEGESDEETPYDGEDL